MSKRILVTGASGQLGAYLVRELAAAGYDTRAWAHSRSTTLFGVQARPVELTNRDDLARAFQEGAPEVVIHAAAVADVNKCASDPAWARYANSAATADLADLCDRASARLVFVSTDLVFDGERGHYSEADAPSPTSVYGQTKVAGERAVLAIRRSVVVRVSWMFGPTLIGRKAFFDQQVEALRGGQPRTLFQDEWRTPLALLTAAQALIGIAKSEASGLIHVGGPERMSRWEVGQRLAGLLKCGTEGLQSGSRTSVAGEPRPRDVSLDSTRWRDSFPDLPWPSFEQALAEMGVG